MELVEFQNPKTMKKSILLLAIAGTLVLSSFTFVPMSFNNNFHDEVKELKQKIKLGKANVVKALINIKGGKLIISNNTNDLADVEFEYKEKYWNPDVSYTESNSNGKLIVKSNTILIKDKDIEDNECRIALNKKLNYALGLDLGVGVAEVDMEGYHIDKALLRLGVGSFDFNFANTSIPLLKVQAGIGEAIFDLSGKWNNNLAATIKAGIGEIEFIVPHDVGVRFKINGFLGEVSAKGFRKTGKTYINKAYNDSDIKLEFDVTGAIGSIKITQI